MTNKEKALALINTFTTGDTEKGYMAESERQVLIAMCPSKCPVDISKV